MRAEDLQVVLRPRSGWEAVELGCALVRRHAGAVWRPWLAFSLPVFALVNALFWWLDQIWLAGLVLWWWLPVFDRIPLYVLSRAVFGQPPGTIQTLRALPDWRRGRLVAHLTWRRLNPWRAVGLPVDLLEDGSPADKRQRRRHIIRGQWGHGMLLAWLCVHFVLILVLAVLMAVVMFVPMELLSDSVRVLLDTLIKSPPRWAQVLMNAVVWLGLSVIEPFHIGAGFGLYLNRRVHLEGWDIELTLRRLCARLGRSAAAAMLAACVWLPGMLPLPVAAQDNPSSAASAMATTSDDDDTARRTLADLFGTESLAEVQTFVQALETAEQDPLLNQQQTRQRWIRTQWDWDVPEVPDSDQQPWSFPLAQYLARLGELLLWLLAAGLVLALLLTARRWWPWMRRAVRRRRPPVPTPAHTRTPVAEPPLPSDLLAHARALWQAGARRQALAVLYRGSVARLSEASNTPLPASATEAECLHLARGLTAAGQHSAFAHLVQVWQRAAYAGRWPSDADFETLGAALAQQPGWSR